MIHARGLARSFTTRKGREKTEVTAVAGVDLDVEAGEIVGFLGPNGAGKTTTLRMLTTLLRPTAGTATVAGFDVATEPEQVRRSIGYVSQAGSTLPDARAGEEVVDHGMLYGISKARATARGQELFAQLDLDGLWTRKPGAMSGGQRRRLDIAMGLVHDPTLIFLDEPTTGLDPQARANLWQHIAALRTERGATVFLTTHYLDEADALCDRILVIDHGRIVASDTPEALKQSVSGDLVELVLGDAASVPRAATALAALVPGGEAQVDGRSVSMRVPHAGRELAGLLRSLDRDGITLESIEVRRPTLDDVFLTVTGRSLREDAA
ncbi:MAG TPA: ATP-binding cassette domain-containing protein [Pseudolysinimonas sp.]|jgi:ABC-2 type transport system ATP-binding protein|nr:ATP-binding cassette domain-containing protein [Pseudolysinimonas sp.]